MPPIPVTCPHCTRVELREYIMGSVTACTYCKKTQQLVVCPTCKQGNSFPSCTYHDSLPFPCCGCGKAGHTMHHVCRIDSIAGVQPSQLP